MKNLLLASAAFLLITGCEQTSPKGEAIQDVAVQMSDVKTSAKKGAHKGASKGAQTGARDIGNRGEVMMSIQSLDRLAGDKADDKIRKTAQVLQFTGVWPGMTVVELEAGQGYYTELLSRIVGKDGKVVMQNPRGFDAFFKPDAFDGRLGADGKRLANVTHSRTNFDALAAPDASVDMVTWFLGPHELWMKNKKGEMQFGDPAKTYAEIYRVLKPGGKFIALDHVGLGEDEAVGGTLHRIPPKTVTTRAEAAGLKLVKTSHIFFNKADDHLTNVFDPKIKRKTDRFLHMYVKPK